MIRASFYRAELRELKALYSEGVFEAEDRTSILIKNFKPPDGYKCNRTYLFFEIPSGFGFGVNIQHTWILLRKSAAHFHLVHIPKDAPYIEKALAGMNVRMPKDYGKEWAWYWICFHTPPLEPLNPVFGAIAEKSGSGEFGDPDDPMEASFSKYTGLTEHTKLVTLALNKILYGDPDFVRELDAMNRGRDEIIRRHQEQMEAFEFSNNWRTMRWLWD
ncbi:MAG: hypothetical protein A2Y33_06235 [Spirochaetes bacterium GWF1_51_8]|nr:MAG: hypothetical protein A2Y33_06235 [Spirochaetes bacterium GWF1_51_8]